MQNIFINFKYVLLYWIFFHPRYEQTHAEYINKLPKDKHSTKGEIFFLFSNSVYFNLWLQYMTYFGNSF